MAAEDRLDTAGSDDIIFDGEKTVVVRRPSLADQAALNRADDEADADTALEAAHNKIAELEAELEELKSGKKK